MSGAPFEYSMSRRQALSLLGASAIVPFDSMKAATAPTSEALHFIGLQEAASRIASRALSPVQLTQHMLDRIAQVDPVLYGSDRPTQPHHEWRRLIRCGLGDRNGARGR